MAHGSSPNVKSMSTEMCIVKMHCVPSSSPHDCWNEHGFVLGKLLHCKLRQLGL